jgi:cytochrome bd ubiquinol oxidase subunit I
MTAAFIFYYYWGRLPEKAHVIIGWIYAAAAWISLVLITGITAFMLNPGVWATQPDSRDFWTAFFNPQFLPQTIARTGGALLLSSLYVYLHASLTIRDARLRDMIAARSARPALLGAVLITAGGLGWYYYLPDSSVAALRSAAVLNVLVVLIFALTIVVFFLLYFGPYRNPGWLSPGFAGALCLFGIAAFSTGEFIREAVRKPFVVYNVVLGNQVLPPQEVLKFRDAGYLESGRWTRAYVAENHPQTIVDGQIQGYELLKLPHKDRIALGHVLFQYHCNDCHATTEGYSAVGPLLGGRSRSLVHSTVEHLESVYFMPPWCGTADEAELMTDYLMSINPPRPSGMIVGVDNREVN